MRTLFSKQSLLILLFGLSVFVKNILFYQTCFHSLLLSSVITNPLEFVVFYGTKAFPALFLMAVMLLTRKWWWTIIVSVILDIWRITNILYYIFFNLFFTWDVLSLVNNMDGFWGSLLPYLNMSIWIYPLITLCYTLLFIFLYVKQSKRYVWQSCIILLIVLLADIGINKYRYVNWYSAKSKEEVAWTSLKGESSATFYLPFGLLKMFGLFTDSWGNSYVKAQSIDSYLVASFIDYARKYIHVKPKLETTDIQTINQLTNPQDEQIFQPHYNLLFILVESLESWPILDTINGHVITPNLNRLIMDTPILYCSKIKSQILKGGSGDGQMIVNTGLLPISAGAACTSYGDNVYPNFAHMFTNSSIINPTPNAWNQYRTTYSYGYKELMEPEDRWTDIDIMYQVDTMIAHYELENAPWCIFAITYNSHSPFKRPNGTQLTFEQDMPLCLASYLDCINYVDSCLSTVLEKVDLDSTIVVITGDHIIFKDAMLAEYAPYARKADLTIKTGCNYCPLIVYSPDIESSIVISDTCYQMDIYPTIMHLIGCEDYYWKGFGVNLLDSVARHNRPISEQEAYRLSDMIIRGNYFSIIE